MARLAKSKHFQELLAEIVERWMDPPSKTFARITLLNRSFLSKVWHCRAVTYIFKQIKEEIAFILQQCQEHLLGTHCWKRPISHIVCRRLNARRTREQLQPCKTVANPLRTGFEGTDEQLCMDVELCVLSGCWPRGKTFVFVFN